MNRFLSIVVGLLLLALLFSVTKCSDNSRQLGQQAGNISALTSELKITRDAVGRVSAEKQVAQLSAAEFLKINAGKDEQIKNLQDAVKAAGKNAQSATAFHAKTVNKAVGKVDSISYRKSTLPIYYSDIHAFGYTAKVKAGADSVSIESATTNDFTVTLYTKNSLFKRPMPTVTIKALNPATGIEAVQSWQETQPRPKRGAWFLAGFIAGLIVPL